MKPPAHEEKERYILGSMMMDYEVALEVTSIISPEDFFQPMNKSLAESCWKVVQAGRIPTNIDMLDGDMSLDKLNLVGGLTAEVYSPSVAPEYAQDVADAAFCRKAMIEFAEVVKEAQSGKPETTLDKAQKALLALTQVRKLKGAYKLKEVITEAFDQIEEAYKSKGMTGVRTGFRSIDAVTGGWQTPDLVVLAGRPGMGKTALLMQYAQGAADSGVRVGVFSLEMSRHQLAKRMIGSESGVGGFKLQTGKLSDSDWPPLGNALAKLADLDIWIDDTGGLTLSEIHSRARKMKQDHDIGLLVVDYLQLIKNPGSKSRADEVSEIARGLKNIGKELHIPVITAAQLSRAVEGRDNADRRPNLSHLKESGGIEENADLVAFIFREEYYNPDTERKGIAEIIIAKHRNGPCLTQELGWIGTRTKFVDLDRRHSA